MGIQSTIEAEFANMAPSIRRVAGAVRENPAIVIDQTITEVASTCQTSVASVVRFCQAIGLSGYAELRMALASELGRESAQYGGTLNLADIERGDSLRDMASKVCTLEMLAIEETVAGLDYDTMERVIEALDNAPRVLLFGIGASYLVAQDLQHKLLRIGRNAFLPMDAHEAWAAAALPLAGTVAIAISHQGRTPETVRFLQIAGETGSLGVAVTSTTDSPLAQPASAVLLARARESNLRPGAMVSRIAQLALMDCLFLGIARRSYDETLDALRRTREVTRMP
jgi:DNA-binding MurR/RpiR family transcriptional regulator